MSASFWHAVIRFIIVIVVSFAVILGIYFVLPLVYPFIIGLGLALLFNPAVNFLERKAKVPRWLTVIFSILLLLAILTTIITLVVFEIASEINKLREILPEYTEHYIEHMQSFIMSDLVPFYDNFTAFYSSLDHEVRQQVETQVESFSQNLVVMGQTAVQNILNGILAFLGSIPSMATAFIISLLASFFISKDWPRLRVKFIKLMPDIVQSRGAAVLKDLRQAIFGFIRAQLTLISITFCIVLIGFLILRIEYGLTIALIIALVDLLPYLGTGLVFIPWIVYLFLNGDYGMVLGLSILYAIVLVQRQMMEPKILGDNVGLDPLLTLFALFVGFQLFGLFGLIIGPALMVIISALYRAGLFRDIWNFIKTPQQ